MQGQIIDINTAKLTAKNMQLRASNEEKSKIIIDLQKRIDEAIEYIEGFDIDYLHETMEHGLADNLEIILEILKGDSNE